MNQYLLAMIYFLLAIFGFKVVEVLLKKASTEKLIYKSILYLVIIIISIGALVLFYFGGITLSEYYASRH